MQRWATAKTWRWPSWGELSNKLKCQHNDALTAFYLCTAACRCTLCAVSSRSPERRRRRRRLQTLYCQTTKRGEKTLNVACIVIVSLSGLCVICLDSVQTTQTGKYFLSLNVGTIKINTFCNCDLIVERRSVLLNTRKGCKSKDSKQ